jgi:hypothetical protein
MDERKEAKLTFVCDVCGEDSSCVIVQNWRLLGGLEPHRSLVRIPDVVRNHMCLSPALFLFAKWRLESVVSAFTFKEEAKFRKECAKLLKKRGCE